MPCWDWLARVGIHSECCPVQVIFQYRKSTTNDPGQFAELSTSPCGGAFRELPGSFKKPVAHRDEGLGPE
jgi:hypothetical protein